MNKSVMDAINNYWKTNLKPPTMRDIVKESGYALSAVHAKVKQLEKEGLVEVFERKVYPTGLYEQLMSATKGVLEKFYNKK